ncbi:Nuclear distribution protein nudE-like 1 [Clonorchis sinensis]|uniref:Nuclear distribution protein nudE-like 1 n=1 Tax=Clonorchis sinensis TaxID=79923 RepID=A0A8T1M436_CLOSI|nr:Nuclear distribution protein nudE-like 1 [Clonorchis sinensis]
MASLSFKDVNEEVEYWRRMAEEYKQAMEEAREELEDFQISSRELERELEIQLGQLEKQNEALILSNEKLISERDQLRPVKFTQMQRPASAYSEGDDGADSALQEEYDRLQNQLRNVQNERQRQTNEANVKLGRYNNEIELLEAENRELNMLLSLNNSSQNKKKDMKALEDLKQLLEQQEALHEKIDQTKAHHKQLDSEIRSLEKKICQKQQERAVQYKNEKEQQQRYIREMEQRNDDLERANRATVVSLEAFELQLNEAIEHNAILENELDEKRDLIVTVQRLKDETRDLQQELAVIRRQPASHSASLSNGHLTDVSAPSKHSTEIMVQTEPYSVPAPLLTPSTRIAALNMVNDALQKIGHLELKLSQLYRSYGAPPLSAPPNAFVPPALPGSPFGGTVNGGSGKLPSSHSYQRRNSLRSWTNGSLLMDHPAAQSEAHDSSLRVIE